MPKPKTKITNDVLHVGYVLDASGSMRAATEATKEAVEQYIEDLRAEEAKIVKKFGEGVYTYLTLNAFSTTSRQLLEPCGINDFDIPSVIDQYNASGGTALYDAIGDTISYMEQTVRPGEKVLIAILTDGMENSSRRYNAVAISNLIEAKEEEGWTFTYLAAGISHAQAVRIAATFGVSSGSVASFDTTTDSYANVGTAFAAMSGTLRSAKNMAEVKDINTNLYASAGIDTDLTSTSET